MSDARESTLFGWLRKMRVPFQDRRLAASDVFYTLGGDDGPRPIYGKRTRGRGLGEQITGPRPAQQRRLQMDPESTARATSRLRMIVLHQTTIPSVPPLPADASSRLSHHRVDHVIANFVVTRRGEVVYVRDLGYHLNSLSARRGIDIEFIGDYPHDDAPPTSPHQRLTAEAIHAGRELVRGLKRMLPGLTNIHTHGQFKAGKLDTCPGPDIWVNVGEWALLPANHLGLTSDPPLGRTSNPVSPAQRNSSYWQSQ
jgi:hypothetical protein